MESYDLTPVEYEEAERDKHAQYARSRNMSKASLPEGSGYWAIMRKWVAIAVFIAVEALMIILGIVGGNPGEAIVIALTVGILESLIGAFFFGYCGVLPAVLFPIAYPIYRAVMRKKERAVELVNFQIEEEIGAHKRATIERIASYKRKYSEYVLLLSKHYKDKDLVEKASEEYATTLFVRIKEANRASYVDKVKVSITCEVTSKKIGGPGAWYTFEYYRMENLSTQAAQDALLHALAEKIREKVMLKLEALWGEGESKVRSEGEGNERHSIEIKYDYRKERADSFFETTITYTENNPNFVPVQQW